MQISVSLSISSDVERLSTQFFTDFHKFCVWLGNVAGRTLIVSETKRKYIPDFRVVQIPIFEVSLL